jgi:prepilin-type N-terminal cleavage/methylation domain-containing protein
MTRTRAFTLIELLVVITVIFILAAAVLASLSGAKGRGNDTSVKANLATIQVQGTLYFGIGNTFGVSNTGANAAACTTASTLFKDAATTIEDTIGNAITSATKAAKGNNVFCRSDASTFWVAGQLANNQYWCVDSVGNALATSAPTTVETRCN